jgi:hypothetical protein
MLPLRAEGERPLLQQHIVPPTYTCIYAAPQRVSLWEQLAPLPLPPALLFSMGILLFFYPAALFTGRLFPRAAPP